MSNAVNRPDASDARSRRGATRIGDWVLHPDLGLLRRKSVETRLNAKTLHVLLVLLDADEQGVSREKLLNEVWGESYPTDNVVSRAIADLRSAFGEKAGEQRYIRTLPKYGYQLLAEHGPVTDGSPRDRGRGLKGSYLGLVVLVLFAGVAASFLLTRQNETNVAAVVRLPAARPLTAAPGMEHQPRLSPEAKWVIYAALRPGRADWDLFRVSTDDGTSQPVAVTPDVQEHGPAFSPVGDEVAYVRLTSTECNVVVQSVSLGVPDPLVPCTSQFPTLVDWSPDGNWIAYTANIESDSEQRRRIHRINRFSGETKELTDAVSRTGSDFYPRYSPSGSTLAFLRGEPQPDHRSTLWTVDVASGIETQITHQPSQLGGMAWISESVLMYSIGDAGHFSGRWLDLETGAEYPIDRIDLIHADYSAGSETLVATELRSDLDLLLLRADGSSTFVSRSTSDDHHGALSPDEAWVAFISRRSGFDEVWLAETASDIARRLTRFDGSTVRYPSWHPDGRRIMFTVQADAAEHLYEVDIVSGAVRGLGPGGIEVTTPRWLPDGERWVYGCREKEVWGVCVGDIGGVRRIADHYFRPEPLDNTTLAAVDSGGTLHSININDGAVRVIWQGLPADGRFGWTNAGDDLIYLAGGDESNRGHVVRRDKTTGAESIVYEGAMPLADVAISHGNRSGSVLITTFQSSSDDLVMFPNVPSSR